MKIEGLEFMDWLHKIRKTSEAERKRKGLSGSEWLKQIEIEAANLLEERQTKNLTIKDERPKN